MDGHRSTSEPPPLVAAQALDLRRTRSQELCRCCSCSLARHTSAALDFPKSRGSRESTTILTLRPKAAPPTEDAADVGGSSEVVSNAQASRLTEGATALTCRVRERLRGSAEEWHANQTTSDTRYAQSMHARPIDPRDTEIEITSPTYRVFFWKRLSGHPDSGYKSEEYEIADADDVRKVLEWAKVNAGDDRTYEVHVVVDNALVHLFGQNPTGTQ